MRKQKAEIKTAPSAVDGDSMLTYRFKLAAPLMTPGNRIGTTSIMERWKAALRADLKSAVAKLEAGATMDEFTDDERFAIAIMSGVQWELEERGGTWRPTTAPCSIAIVDGKFLVAIHQENYNREIREPREMGIKS